MIRIYPSLDARYQDLHRNPELSKHEDKTAAKLAARLRELGFEGTEHVLGTGIVGVPQRQWPHRPPHRHGRD